MQIIIITIQIIVMLIQSISAQSDGTETLTKAYNQTNKHEHEERM